MSISLSEVGQVKVKNSSFQTGLSVLVSLLFLVYSTSSPAVTLIQHSMSPNVLVLLLNSAVSNLKLRMLVFSSLKVADSVTSPACLLSQLRKHLRVVDLTGLGYPTVSFFQSSGSLICSTFRQGSRSIIPQPITSSLPILWSMSQSQRHLPKVLQELLTMNLQLSLNLGFFPPFLTTYPLKLWLENLTLTQGSIVENLLVQCQM